MVQILNLTKENTMIKSATKFALIAALALAPTLPALSQTGTGTGTSGTGTTTTTQDNTNYNNEGRNGYWGLLGLLGLFGLLGRKSHRDETATTAYRDPDAVGSTRDRY
jgi:hypothetical protein